MLGFGFIAHWAVPRYVLLPEVALIQVSASSRRGQQSFMRAGIPRFFVQQHHNLIRVAHRGRRCEIKIVVRPTIFLQQAQDAFFGLRIHARKRIIQIKMRGSRSPRGQSRCVASATRKRDSAFATTVSIALRKSEYCRRGRNAGRFVDLLDGERGNRGDVAAYRLAKKISYPVAQNRWNHAAWPGAIRAVVCRPAKLHSAPYPQRAISAARVVFRFPSVLDRQCGPAGIFKSMFCNTGCKPLACPLDCPSFFVISRKRSRIGECQIGGFDSPAALFKSNLCRRVLDARLAARCS